jgi:hypothetical protein
MLHHRTPEMAAVRAALFALQNTYAYGTEKFQRVYRMRIELDQIDCIERVSPTPPNEVK